MGHRQGDRRYVIYEQEWDQGRTGVGDENARRRESGIQGKGHEQDLGAAVKMGQSGCSDNLNLASSYTAFNNMVMYRCLSTPVLSHSLHWLDLSGDESGLCREGGCCLQNPLSHSLYKLERRQ